MTVRKLTLRSMKLYPEPDLDHHGSEQPETGLRTPRIGFTTYLNTTGLYLTRSEVKRLIVWLDKWLEDTE